MEFNYDIHPDLEYQYRTAVDEVSQHDAMTPDNCLSAVEVLRAHFLIADFFLNQGDGIGGVGPRDTALLSSAVSRQWVGLGDKLKWATPFERAATLLYGLVCNHAFHDANKRTAFLSTAHYLLKCGYMLTTTERELENFTVEIAGHQLKKYPRFRDLLKRKANDPEVLYIAWYLKKNSRRVQHTKQAITFRDLDKTLKRFDYYLDDPSGNRISVYKDKTITKGIFRRRKQVQKQRICRIGFPGWTKQISKKDLDYLRKKLQLTTEYGVDSAAFFQDADNIRNLIDSYEGALRRLAYR